MTKRPPASNRGTSTPQGQTPRYVAPDTEVDLHRMTVPQAIAAVDRALLRADSARLPYLRIVHGHGTGTLRGAVIEHVQTHRLVTRYESAAPAEGGYGVTIAVLKRSAPKPMGRAEAARLSTPVPLKRK